MNAYDAARRVSTVNGIKNPDALNLVAVLTDGALDRGDLAGIEQALALGGELLTPTRYQTLAAAHRGYLHYSIANAWDARAHLAPDADVKTWEWHAEPLEQQIFHLRTAVAIADLPTDLRVRATTNLANALDRVGRFVEAIAIYDLARSLAPTYGMPAGNRGILLKAYASAVPDPGHAAFLLHHAADALKEAVGMNLDHESIRQQMQAVLVNVQRAHGDHHLLHRTFSLGKSKGERAYRAWALRERLFLNPLNDLGEVSIAAHDPLTPGSIVIKVGEGPHLFGFFNTMKQEYASARFFLYQGLHRNGVPFADLQVKLVNTMDCPVHRLGTEEVKVAYRLSYSLLDKVANFLNAYFDLGVPDRDVSFRKVWFTDKKRALQPAFCNLENWPLRGLFWISKDLFERREEHAAVLDPDARDLADIRHAMEHKHLKVVEAIGEDGCAGPYPDPTARLITPDDLAKKALRMLRLARASLIHLACGIAAEERKRAADRTKITPPILLTDWEDEWKR